ncbi:MAG: putative flagellar basal-body rod protein [Phycisphaerales bacterium]|nr:putative flagellar basal-body rod protein [Phycisphaerales bacterium]
MFSVLNIAASGLSAASARLAVTAGNIANADSTGYQARRVTLSPAPPTSPASPAAGVRVDTVTLDSYPGGIDAEGDPTSNVDLARESVDLIRERHQYTANAKLLKAGDEMLGTLLDVLAK